jgi:DNA-directed RNA polymerase I subunit RPA43
MLSLQGSIQQDPFSPAHVAQLSSARQTEETETDIDQLEKQLEEESDEDVGSDVDTFKLLGHQAAQAAAADKRKRKVEETEPEPQTPKKKRKGQKEGEIVIKSKRKKKAVVGERDMV